MLFNKTTAVILLSIGIFSSCSNESKEKINETPAIKVTAGKIGENNSGDLITASGKTEAVNSANLSTRMMGYVTKLHVKIGQKVSEGQMLISINNTDLQAKKAQVEAGVMQATAAYNSAKKDYDRFVVLFSQQSASQKELDDMTARFEIAKAGLESARQMRNEVNAQFSYVNIKAPFSGVVTNTFIKEGDMANPGMPLVCVEGPSHLQVTAMVAESDISNIKTGMSVKLTIKSTNKTIEGKVSEMSLSAKNTGGQYIVKINLPKTDKSVLPGMFANVEFPIANTNVSKSSNDKILLPQSALIHQGQLTGVYTIGNDNAAILRWVRTGKTNGEQTEILSGISTGETYVLKAEGKIFNGAKLIIQ